MEGGGGKSQNLQAVWKAIPRNGAEGREVAVRARSRALAVARPHEQSGFSPVPSAAAAITCSWLLLVLAKVF